MDRDIRSPALHCLTFHRNVMENQTSLSVHRAIKDKCVCYCSHSVFLSVLCPPSGDVKACCRSTINPKLSRPFCRKGMLLSGRRWNVDEGWTETSMTAPLRTEWTAASDEWPASLLITKHSHQVRHSNKGIYEVLKIPSLTN